MTKHEQTLGDTWNNSTKNSSLHDPFDASLAEFPSGCREQSCVCVEGESKGNMSHDHLLSEPNEAPFSLSNLPLTSAALAAIALVNCRNPVCVLVWSIVYATRIKTNPIKCMLLSNNLSFPHFNYSCYSWQDFALLKVRTTQQWKVHQWVSCSQDHYKWQQCTLNDAYRCWRRWFRWKM